MLLQNFDHHLTAIMAHASLMTTTAEVTAAAATTPVKSTYGSITSSVPVGQTSSGGGGFHPISLSEKSICIGDGNTPVSYGDFKLAGTKIGNTFTKVSNTLDFDEDSHCFVRTLVVKYSNTSNTDFVVKEWGIWRTCSSGITAYSNDSSSVYLVYREVLEEPITIAANSTATLTFTLKIPHEMNAF